MQGGYKIIDLQDINIVSNQSTTITGIYEAIESNYRKPLLLSRIQINGTEYNDLFIEVTSVQSNWKFIAYGYQFTITSADGVVIVAV